MEQIKQLDETELVLLYLGTNLFHVEWPDSASRWISFVAVWPLPRPCQDAYFEAINDPLASVQ